MTAQLQKFGKAFMAGLGVAMVSLYPTYGHDAWYIALPAIYTALATYMSAPSILPTTTVTVNPSQEKQQ